MKTLLVLISLLISAFAAEIGKYDVYVKATTLNGTALAVVHERLYYTICVDGYKWVQFASKIRAETDDKIMLIVNDGLPIQMFSGKAASVPVVCD